MKRKEYRCICLLASDSWSGNHLLRPRTSLYKKIAKEFVKALKAKSPSNRQKELINAYKAMGGAIYEQH